MGHPPWSSVIFNKQELKKLGGFHYPFNLPNIYAEQLEILADEFFACQFLLSSIGDVAISDHIVSIRGRPKTSFTLSNKDWHKCIGQAAFVVHYNLMKSSHEGIYIQSMKKRAREMLNIYPVERINKKIFDLYKGDTYMQKLYFISYTYYLLRHINYYYRNFVKLIFICKDRGFKNTFLYLKNRIKSKGLINVLFQIK